MRGKKQGASDTVRTAGCELKLFGRQGEAVAPSAGREMCGATSTDSSLLTSNWQAKIREHNTAACKRERLQSKRSTLRYVKLPFEATLAGF
jgi:hypothetical protein